MTEQLFSPESGIFPGDPEPDFFEALNPAIPIPERLTIVPSWYVRHQNPTTTVVTQGGKQVAPGFVVSMVAPELRWAIREDGELLEQLEFQQAHERWYTAQYQFAGQPADDPNLRSIPRVERFVSRCVDPDDSSRLQPIRRRAKEAPPPIQPIYNADGERIEEAGEVEMPTGLSLKEPTKVEAPLPLEEKTEESVEEQRRASMIARGKDPDFRTPCGKPYPAGQRYIHLHTSRCSAVECNPEK